MKLNYLVCLIAMYTIAQSCSSNTSSNKSKIVLKEVATSGKFSSDTMSIWGASMVKGDDGQYHMFYSRWKKDLGWAWVTHSEIAHAVSDSPYGPFKHKDVTLPPRGDQYWDGLCTHNPNVHKFDGKYYLYYMGNTGNGLNPCEPGKLKYNWQHRNNQRIGVAVADNPNGPWVRMKKPVLDVATDSLSMDALLVSNPSVTRSPNGSYLMVYKAVGKKNKRIQGGPVVHCVATSDSPTGPFIKHKSPIFTAEGYDFPAEDPYIWFQDNMYRAIVKDMHGAFTDAGKSLVFFESKDGIDWKLSADPIVSTLQINWKGKGIQKLEHLERPQLFFEEGKPVVLLCAADTKDENNVLHSFNVQIPIEMETK